MDNARVELRSPDGNLVGHLVLSGLPRSAIGPVEALHDPERPSTAPIVEVREGATYRYRLEGLDASSGLEPVELFDSDDESRLTGRLVPGESVGVVTVEVGDARGRFTVRPAKLADEGAFQTMLGDLASRAVEALHQGFAPSAGRFSHSPDLTPRLLYQQFAVLHALLFGQELEWAVGHVTARPHRTWATSVEIQQPGRPLRGTSRLSATLTRPGRRVLTPGGPLPTLPARIMVEKTEETLDTIPNRYVRSVLERWRALAVQALRGAESLQGAALRRGVFQAQRTIDRLDELLGASLFREVHALATFPRDNQVLLRREGYRQVAVAAAIVEGSLGLSLDLKDPFLVSSKSIATLYEYWTFVRLAGAVARACGAQGQESQLFEASGNGMSLLLRTGKETSLTYQASVAGTPVLVDLHFNRTFGAAHSWTRPMRPDASLRLRAGHGPEVWLHFDAKYKVEWLEPFSTGDVEGEEEAERVGKSKRADLLKMHAYRDAIRNSAAAYVLFPGSTEKAFPFSDEELLPALGAFPLRPDLADGDAARLESFVRQAIGHVAAVATRHRRASFWTNESYTGPGTSQVGADLAILERPPADTPVLVGYVRSDAQWRWIESQGLYNIRSGDRTGAVPADAPELDTPLVLLYGHVPTPGVALFQRVGSWGGLSNQAMRHLDYPEPRGDSYLVAPLEIVGLPAWLASVDPSEWRALTAPLGAPFVVSWLDVILHADRGSTSE